LTCTTFALCISLWLTAHGYSPTQRDAVLTYVGRESGFQANSIANSGVCLFQWAGVRRRQVLALGGGRCPPWEVQMEFADRELRTVFAGFWAARDPASHMRRCFGMGRADR